VEAGADRGKAPANSGSTDIRDNRADTTIPDGAGTRVVASPVDPTEHHVRDAHMMAREEDDHVEPQLLVPIERTPLPDVDRAMPVLSLFPAVVGRRRGRYKVALLKTIQTDRAGRWKIRQIQDVVFWLQPSVVAELVRDLRDAEVLTYDPIRATYRLSTTGRIVGALLSALTLPQVDPRRLIKYLSLTMSLAIVGGGANAAKASFASAVAVLRSDLEELRRLIDDRSTNALREAAELAEAHVQDMRELLDEHEHFRIQSSGDPDFLRLEHDALALAAKLSDAIGDLLLWLTGKANEVMRGGAAIDRGDVRDFITDQTPAQLAQLVLDLVARPPFTLHIPATVAFDSWAERSGSRRPSPPPLPVPSKLVREAPPVLVDPTMALVNELRALDRETSAADFVVRCDWPTSVARHAAFIDAYSRRNRGLPSLELLAEIEEPQRAGVARISKTTIRPIR
jgi:hypothetical protein